MKLHDIVIIQGNIGRELETDSLISVRYAEIGLKILNVTAMQKSRRLRQ